MLEREQREILNQLSEGVIVADTKGRLTFVNRAAIRFHGVERLDIDPHEYSATYNLFTLAGEPYPAEELPLVRAVNGETISETRWRIRRPDGTEVLAVGSASPVIDAAGKQIGAVLTIRDDTARAAAEREIRESEARLRALTDNLPGAVVYQLRTDALGLQREFLYVSQTHEALTGITAEAVMADATIPYRMVHPDDLPRMLEAGATAIREKAPYDLEVRYRRSDGEERWSRAISVPREQDDGSLIWDGLQIDVTEQVRTKLELEHLNATLGMQVQERTRERDRAWEYSRDLQAVLNAQGKYVAANEAWLNILGWEPHEVVGRSMRDFIHPEDAPSSADFGQGASSPDVPPVEIRFRHRDGSYRWFSWVAAPEGRATYASGRHITVEKEAREALAAASEELRQAQKMEAVGQLTGGIAHDFNNLLGGIIGSLDAIARRVSESRSDDVLRYVEAAQGAANRAATLIQRLLAFSRRQTLDPKAVAVGHLLSGMEQFVRASVDPGIGFRISAPDDLWPVLVDPAQLESALLNLCINARDAMPDGGLLTIKATNTRLSADHATEGSLPAGDYVRISVSDSGIGMSPEVMRKAFEPFFTTKPLGQGTGLGLSMVHGFVNQSKGEVRVESQLGEGSTVHMTLPRFTGPAITRDNVLPSVPTAGHGQLVLVIDDEPLIRMLVVEALDAIGYRVLQASDGPMGLDILKGSDAVDLLVTDVGLPGGMNGRQVADAARVHKPDLPVLFITGYAESAAIGDGALDPGMSVLTKPFTDQELTAKAGEMLELGAGSIGQ